MADKKISQLGESTTPVAGDYTVIVSSGTTQKILWENLYSKAFTTVKNIDPAETISSPSAANPISLSKEYTILSASSPSTYGLAASTHGNRKVIVATTAGAHAITVQSASKPGSAVGPQTFSLGLGAHAKLENIGGVWYLTSGATWS